MRQALVFGGSGQIGMPLLRRLQRDGWSVDAVSRTQQPLLPGVSWLRGDLQHVDGLPDAVDAIFSCGPLDHFGRWYAQAGISAPRVVAFGSTSVEAKRDSVDPDERDVARRLADGEQNVFATADARGAAAIILRPTLVYGTGRDQTLSRIASLARRWGRLPLPRGAVGLRQPVHVDDLADAAIAACAADVRGLAYALPGGETLPYREMVQRVLAVLQPSASLLELPQPLFLVVASAARLLGRDAGIGHGALARMREDLVFDMAPARAAFGYAPRAFQPDAAMFVPGQASNAR